MNLIGAENLIDGNKQYVIIDTRKHPEYEAGHIAGAHSLPIDYWLKKNDENGIARGMRIISQAAFISLLSCIGVDDTADIVVYDDNSGRGSTRFWIVAQQYGVKNVSILDGGWGNYVSQNLPVESGTHNYRPFPCYLQKKSQEYIISLQNLLIHYPLLKIVDARSDKEWTGEDLHGNPRGGHLPNAIHLNWEELVSRDKNHTFINREEIISKASKLGLKSDDAIVTYCQAGIRAAFVAAALIYAGFKNVRVYDGSMCEWSRIIPLKLER